MPVLVAALGDTFSGTDFLNLLYLGKTGAGLDLKDDRGVFRRTVNGFLISCCAIDKTAANMT